MHSFETYPKLKLLDCTFAGINKSEKDQTETLLAFYQNGSHIPWREAGGFLMSPPVWNFRAVTVWYHFSISPPLSFLLPSPVALFVLSFSAFVPFSWPFFPKSPFFWKVALLCGFCRFCVFERLGDEYFTWCNVQHMLPYGTVIILYTFI